VDLGEVPYEQAMQRMATWTAERRAGSTPDRLFLLSHPAVITYGRTTPLRQLSALAQLPMPTEAAVRDAICRQLQKQP